MPERNITDSNYRLMSRISASLEGEYVDDAEMWAESPFQWIKSRPSRQVGAIGEKLVRHWCDAKGFRTAKSPDTEADLIISGLRVEIKYSRLWTDKLGYTFQQIRDQNYEYCFCLGVSPFEVHAWFIPKSILMIDKPPTLRPQHGGSSGRDTKWLSFPAATPPNWLRPYGGSLAQVEDLIKSSAKHR